jgi:VanZ family protein
MTKFINKIKELIPSVALQRVMVFFVAVAFILLFGKRGWFPDFYNPNFMAGMIFFAIFSVALVRIVFCVDENKKHISVQEQRHVLSVAQKILTVSWLLDAFGMFGAFQLYKVGLEYDKLLHFFNSFILTILIIYLLEKWDNWSIRKSLIFAFLIFAFCGFLVEAFEMAGDALFQTQMWGQYRQIAVYDTKWDLIFNTLGAFLAAISYTKIKNRFFLKN